jgi:hypothetical protein
MQKEVHITAAKEHLKIGEEYDRKMNAETNPDKKTGLRTVASQNYFYAGINAVEAVLARKEENVGKQIMKNHAVMHNPELFWNSAYEEIGGQK